jgi:hypothetical protein
LAPPNALEPFVISRRISSARVGPGTGTSPAPNSASSLAATCARTRSLVGVLALT